MVYVEDGHGKLRFHRVKAPNVEEFKALVRAISHRVAGFLERRGLDDAMVQLQGHSITYRIAVGPQQGWKIVSLQLLL